MFLDNLGYLHIGVVSKEDFRLKSNLKTSRLALQPPFFAYPIHCVPVDAVNPGLKYLLLEETFNLGIFLPGQQGLQHGPVLQGLCFGPKEGREGEP